MSRIGKRKLTIPTGVTVEVNNNLVSVKGPKGELSLQVIDGLSVSVEENLLNVNVDKIAIPKPLRTVGTSSALA